MTYLTTTRRPRPPVKSAMGDIWDDVVQMVTTGATDNAGVIDLMVGGPVIAADAADPSDNVNQTASGTTTSVGDFTSVGGVCKPKNFPALAAVRAFQGQLNRVAQIKGFAKVASDGAVGPATLALFKKVQAAAPSGSIMGDAGSCMTVAPDVDVLGQQIQQFADSLGAPAQVAGPVGAALSVPSIKTKSGATVIAPDAGVLGSLATLSGAEKLALLGVAGGLGYMLFKKKRHRAIPITRRTRRTSRRR